MISPEMLSHIKVGNHILYQTGYIHLKTLEYEWRSADIKHVVADGKTGIIHGFEVLPTDMREKTDWRYGGPSRFLWESLGCGEIYKLESGKEMPTGIIRQLDDIKTNDRSSYSYDLFAIAKKPLL